MTRARVTTAHVISLLLVALLVFTASPMIAPSSAQSPSMPADQKAFGDALRIKEPDKKIEALEKFLADFPRSGIAASAHQAIFDTLVKAYPDQKEKILERANRAVESAQEFSKPFIYESIATKLFEAGILLDEAERFASQGLAVTEEALAKQARQRKAGYYATLGRIYLKQGKLKEAEQHLKQAREFNPSLASAALGWAELSLKQGNEKQALDAYASAAVSGRLPEEARKQLEALYRKANNDSLKGLEEMLDNQYNHLNPLPVKVAHYQPSAKRADRIVLAEVFTGAGCPPCVAADLAFDALLERYKRTELAVLMYHLHIPVPDPMTNPSTMARSKFYGVQGVPSYALDGKSSGGGGSREMTQGFYDRVNPDVEKQLETAAQADIKLDLTVNGSMIQAKAAVSKITSDSDKLKLHIVLAEDRLRYTGENGIRFHPLVVRSVAGADYGGLPITAKDGQSFDWSFDINAISEEIRKHLSAYELVGHRGEPFTFSDKKHQIDANHLTVVAFVQDEKSKAILQAVSVKVKPAMATK